MDRATSLVEANWKFLKCYRTNFQSSSFWITLDFCLFFRTNSKWSMKFLIFQIVNFWTVSIEKLSVLSACFDSSNLCFAQIIFSNFLNLKFLNTGLIKFWESSDDPIKNCGSDLSMEDSKLVAVVPCGCRYLNLGQRSCS